MMDLAACRSTASLCRILLSRCHNRVLTRVYPCLYPKLRPKWPLKEGSATRWINESRSSTPRSTVWRLLRCQVDQSADTPTDTVNHPRIIKDTMFRA
jgi:hypothetical protein